MMLAVSVTFQSSFSQHYSNEVSQKLHREASDWIEYIFSLFL